MSSRAVLRIAAISGAVVALVAAGRPALAAPVPEIPPEVAAAFAGEALRQAQAGDEGVDADFSGAVRADDIHEIFAFSAQFIQGAPTTEPVTSTGQWTAAIKRADEVLGTLGVWKSGGGPAQPNGFSSDVVLGAALGRVSATEILINDEPNGALYALNGSTARPLNDWAHAVLTAPADLSALQESVAAQYAALRAQPTEDYEDPSGVTVSLVAMASALALGGVLLLLQRRRLRLRAG
jgi:hypothetical protein